MSNAFIRYFNNYSIANIKEVGILVALQAKYIKIQYINKKNKQISSQCVENAKRFHLIFQLSSYRQ